MRLVSISALIATAIAGGTVGLANAATSQYTEPKAEAKVTSRHQLPATYKSWVAEASSEKVCVPMRSVGARQYTECLVGHYEAKTSYELTEYEYKVNRAKGTWSVAYSKITLPKGGVRLTKIQKEARKLPTNVYFKSYGLDEGALILGSNGTTFQE